MRITLLTVSLISGLAATLLADQVRARVNGPVSRVSHTVMIQTDFDSCATGTNQGKTVGTDADLCGATDGISWYDVRQSGGPGVGGWSEVVQDAGCYGGTGRCLKIAISEGANQQSGAPRLNWEGQGFTSTTMGASLRLKIPSTWHFRNDATNKEQPNPNYFKWFDFNNQMPRSPRGIWGFDGQGICMGSVSHSPTDGHSCTGGARTVRWSDLPKETWICINYYGQIVDSGTSRFKTWVDVDGDGALTLVQHYTHPRFFVPDGINRFRYMEFDTNQARPDFDGNYAASTPSQFDYLWLDDVSTFMEDPSTDGRRPNCDMK